MAEAVIKVGRYKQCALNGILTGRAQNAGRKRGGRYRKVVES